ncbi:MAG: CBS domain-containing protein [Planctomycetes bacterium]|nr:CBS domain-containing protein [Planctomycetota bacterium]
MNVKDLMTDDVTCVAPETTLQEAARHMRDLDVGSLPVCGNDRLGGMITDRDIAVRAVAEGRDAAKTKVQDVMSSGVVYCFEDDDAHHASELMQEKQIRRLPVLNRDKRLVGIVALADIARSTDEKESGETLERISEPAHT